MSKWVSCLIFMGSIAQATLGQSFSSVRIDSQKMKATSLKTSALQTSNSSAAYTLQQFETDSVTVKEFSDASGVVFAVGWSGSMNPDFETLLGSYQADYQAGLKDRKIRSKRALILHSGDLIVSSTGHSPHLEGFAYLPKAVPAGVNIMDLQ